MLYLIGIGLQPKHLTFEASEAINDCSAVFLENYTSRYSKGTGIELEHLLEKKVVELGRKEIEEGASRLLEESKQHNIALLVFGNPLVATTHIQLLLDAKKKNVPIRVIPGISTLDALPQTGLDSYKFGRICTIVFQEPNYSPESFFDFVQQNHKNGLHSLCLLDIQSEKQKLMNIPSAIEILETIASKRKQNWFQTSVLVGVAGLTNPRQQILVGTPSELKKKRFDSFPQSLIVCGKLSEKEQEALKELYGWKKK